MTRITIFLASCLVAITFSHCKKETITGCWEPEGTCRQITCDKATSVCYVRTLSDSRCPANAVCVWQGKADVELQFEKAGAFTTFRLSTLSMPGSYATDTTIQDVRIRLKNVTPYPGTTGSPGVELELSCK